MEIKTYHKYVILAIFILVFYLTYLIVKPYIITIIMAVIFSILTYPLYNFIKKKTKRERLSAIITTLFFL